MPAKYTLTVKEGKDKNFDLIDYVGSGFVNQNGYVNLSVNLTRLFKLAKERPELLKEYKEEKQIYIGTNIKVDNSSTNNTYSSNQPVNQTQDFSPNDFEDEIPF